MCELNPDNCYELYNCCDCGIIDEKGCGCPYCFSCNTCDECWQEQYEE